MQKGLTYLVLIIFIIFLFNIAYVFAFDFAKDSGVLETAAGTGHAGLKIFSSDNLPGAIGSVIKIILSFLGVFFLILMIYGGYIWMMARGNDQEVQKAKNIIINALIGLVVILSAYAITYTLMARVNKTGSSCCGCYSGETPDANGCCFCY